MRIAIPTSNEAFTAHFGKSDGLYLCEYDPQTGKIEQPRHISRQARGCESLPNWLCELAVDMVLAGGMGGGAQANLDRVGISYSVGHSGEKPEDVLKQFIDDPDGSRVNACEDHDHDHHHCKH